MRYPDDYVNKIICGDCLEIMRGMPDKCVDLVLTDPPYGIGETNEKNQTRGCIAKTTDFGHYEWDKQKVSNDCFIEMKRISKHQIIFGGNYYGSILGDTSCYIVWDKLNGENDFADCELAWTSFNTATRIYKYRWQGMLQGNMSEKEKRVHPTQKPAPVMRWILDKYAKEGDLICDPFMGSGTTLVGARSLNYDFIGIEINQDYCNIAQNRLDNTQGSLF